MQKAPKRLYAVKYMVFFGVILLIISQFNGFYYTFDATNHYQRGDGFIICYIFPILVLCTQISVIMQNFSALSKYIRTSLALFTLAPLVASIIQIFTYGVSLTNITLVGMAIVLYVFAILNLNDTLEQVRMHELELMKEEQENLLTMFEQTSRALANAIDAKDTYTHGHSARVAKYSGEIARLAGKSENEIHKVYFAALLHDVGKIGISNSIINKNGKLTDEEYAEIKNHPIIGGQILSNISKSPYLELGARYHHERYDGKGYPEGLSGKDIPDIARIIAVADAYDAMTSKRSYREPMPQNLVRSEIENGMGTQFDPKYAQIMLSMIDNDYGYTMREA
ncbi:MAG: HD-GYP domain-containing protein [Eubacterium sp.]|nr:HD-GYP domain-containing protein [Eubacterium sp.]